MASLWGFRPRGLGLSAVQTAEYYARRNAITAAPTVVHLPASGRTSVTRMDYAEAGKQPVALLTINGGGHTVPGPKSFPRIVGRTNHDIDTARLIAMFFHLDSEPPGGDEHRR
jgi:polyhydroxybutyrate depolymerase